MFSFWIEQDTKSCMIARWTAANSLLSDVGCPFLRKVSCIFCTVRSSSRA